MFVLMIVIVLMCHCTCLLIVILAAKLSTIPCNPVANMKAIAPINDYSPY